MDALSFTDVDFLLGHCSRCARDVLTHVDYAEDGERQLCVHCDGPVVDSLHQVKGVDLSAAGYRNVEETGGCGGGGCGGCRVRGV